METIKRARATNTNLAKLIQEKEGRIQIQTQALVQLKEEHKQELLLNQEALEGYVQKNQILQQKVQDLDNFRTELSLQIKGLKSELEKKQQEIASVNELLTASEKSEELEKLKKKVSTLQLSLSKAEEKALQLAKTNEDLVETHANNLKEVKAAHKKEVEERENAFTKEITGLTAANESLQKKLDDVTTQIPNLESKIEELTKYSEKLEKNNSDLTIDVETAVADVFNKSNEYSATLKKKEEEHEEALKKVQADLKQKYDDDLETELKNLSERHNKIMDEKQELYKKAVEQHAAEVQEHERKVQKLNSQLEALTKQLKELRKELESKQKALNECETKEKAKAKAAKAAKAAENMQETTEKVMDERRRSQRIANQNKTTLAGGLPRPQLPQKPQLTRELRAQSPVMKQRPGVMEQSRKIGTPPTVSKRPNQTKQRRKEEIRRLKKKLEELNSEQSFLLRNKDLLKAEMRSILGRVNNKKASEKDMRDLKRLKETILEEKSQIKMNYRTKTALEDRIDSIRSQHKPKNPTRDPAQVEIQFKKDKARPKKVIKSPVGNPQGAGFSFRLRF